MFICKYVNFSAVEEDSDEENALRIVVDDDAVSGMPAKEIGKNFQRRRFLRVLLSYFLLRHFANRKVAWKIV